MFINKTGIRFYAGFPFVAVAAFFFVTGMFKNYMCCILFSFFHEIGHLIPLLLSGVRVKEISLGAFGIRIIKNDISLSYKTECVAALCGPFVNMIFLFVFSVLKNYNEIFILPFNINSGLFIINLLPVRILDGGRFIKNLLLVFYDEARVYRIMLSAELITSVFLVFVLIFTLITDIVNTSYIFFVSALVIIIVLGIIKGEKYTH